MTVKSPVPNERRGKGRKPSHPAPRRKTRQMQACRAPHPGGKCPQCRRGRLDINGLLQLYCPNCGYVADGGGFT